MSNLDLFNILKERLRSFHPERTSDRDLIIIKKIVDKLIYNAVDPKIRKQMKENELAGIHEYDEMEDELDRVFREIANLYVEPYGENFSKLLRDIREVDENYETNPAGCATHIRGILLNADSDTMFYILGQKYLFDYLHTELTKSHRKSKKSHGGKSQRKSKKHHRK